MTAVVEPKTGQSSGRHRRLPVALEVRGETVTVRGTEDERGSDLARLGFQKGVDGDGVERDAAAVTCPVPTDSELPGRKVHIFPPQGEEFASDPVRHAIPQLNRSDPPAVSPSHALDKKFLRHETRLTPCPSPGYVHARPKTHQAAPERRPPRPICPIARPNCPNVVETVMSEQDNLRIARENIEAWNAHDPNRLGKNADEKFIAESDTLPAPVNGAQGLAQFMGVYVTAFPDLRFEIEQQFADGDFVVTRWVATGTHRGDLMGIASTGRRAVTHGCTVSQFKNGKGVHDWIYWDTGNLLRQLGVLPPAT